MSTLTTCGWMLINGQREYREFLIDFENIMYCTSAKDPSGGDSALLVLRGETAVHVDLTFDQLKILLKKHKEFPELDYATHDSFSDDGKVLAITPQTDNLSRKAKGDNEHP